MTTKAKAKPKAVPKVPLRVGIGAPKDVLAAARARGVVLPDVYYGQLEGKARGMAFSIAGLASMDQLEAVKRSLDENLASGAGFRDWKRRVLAGEIPLELPAHRLETIYRTNLQAAYSRGNGEAIMRNVRTHPYLLYSAVNDSRTRPAHSEMGGTIRRYDDPWWATRKPPNGFNCRCRVIALTEAEATRRGITEKPPAAGPDAGWDYDPWADPAAGARRALQRRRARAKPPEADRLAKIEDGARIAGADDPDSWVQVGPQRGSNPGGQYRAPDGREFYVKFYENPDQARAEVAAFEVYKAMGVETLDARIVERLAPDGRRRLGMATAWRNDLRRLDPAKAVDHADDLAAIYQASVLTANWDVVGMTTDNVAVSAAGRVVVLDAGGSFTFRAQGGAKAFSDAEAPELGSLRDPLINRSAAAVFNPALDADVLRERNVAAVSLAGLTDAAIDQALNVANVPAALASTWRAGLRGRRELLRDRYDLDRVHVAESAALTALEREIEALFAGRRSRLATDEVARGGHRYSSAFQGEVERMVPEFERWARKRFEGVKFKRVSGAEVGPVELLRWVFTEWSGNSSAEGGALLKAWAASRFDRQGASINFHGRRGSERFGAEAAKKAQEEAAQWARKTGIKLETLFELLDAEYAFNQLLLRRGYGWGRIILHRYMSAAEATSNRRGDEWRGNAIASYTLRHGGFNGSVLMSYELRTESVMKVWQQGAAYMHFEGREAEYLGIGTRWKVIATGG